jgi:hypothetical protein
MSESAIPLEGTSDLMAEILRAAGETVDLPAKGGVSFVPDVYPLGLPVPDTEENPYTLDVLRLGQPLSPTAEPPLTPPEFKPQELGDVDPTAALFRKLQEAPTPTIDQLSKFGTPPSSAAQTQVTLRGQIRRMLRSV